MPREICQTGKFFRSVRREPPCVTCGRRSTCLVHLAQRQLFELTNPEVNKAHIISSCSGFMQTVASDATGDIRPNLSGSGISHLCRTCEERHADCDEFVRLEEIKRVAKANGLQVSITTLCCSSKKIPSAASSTLPILHQIGVSRSMA